MIVKYDSLDRFEKPKLTLCNPGAKYEGGYLTRVLGTLSDYDSEEIVFNFNSTSDLNFRIYQAEHDDQERNAHAKFLYDAVQNKRLIFVDNVGFFVISETHKGFDGLINYKDITARSVDSEIEQKKVPYIEDGTYQFYTEIEGADQPGLLNNLVHVLPLWSIGTVDEAVAHRWRTFEDVSVDANILSFMLQDMQDAYECIFVFNIINRTIDVFDQNNYVKLTDIHLTKDDLIDTLGIDDNAGDVYTAVTVLGGENITIGAVNPTGLSTIYDFSYYLSWMDEQLRQKVEQWQALIDSKKSEYYDLNLQYYELLSTVSNTSQDIQRLNTQVTIYKRLRDNIVAGASDRALAEYNAVIVQNGGTAVTIADNIQAMLAQIDSLIGDCKDEIARLSSTLNTQDIRLDGLEQSIRVIVDETSMTNFFTEEEYEELYFYIFEGSYNDEYVVITDIMTPAEQFDQMKIMYDRAMSQLKRVSKPTQEYTINVENFVYSSNFEHWSNQLETGCLVNVELEEGDIALLFLTNITINYDDHSLSMTFGNRFNKYDPKTLFVNVLGSINKSANSINYLKETIYPIKSGQFNSMREQIQASRNLTMDAALASENEEVTIDGAGYTSKELREDGTYDPRQVKLTGKNLVFTDDAWETCKVAIGQIILGDGTATYGINAETIIGDLIIGNQLVIKDNEGNDLFTIIDGKISSSVKTIEERLDDTLSDTRYQYVVRDPGVTPGELDYDWSDLYPSIKSAGQHVWRKTIAIYGDESYVTKAIEDITGEAGDSGADGISVTKITYEYCLSGSDKQITPIITVGSAEAIAGDDVYPSESEWVSERSTEHPKYIPGYYFWRRTVTTYSDGHVEYGEPYLDVHLNDVWKTASENSEELERVNTILTEHSTSITQTDERITSVAQSVEVMQDNTDRKFSAIEQRADGIEATVSHQTSDIHDLREEVAQVSVDVNNINLSIREDIKKDYVTKNDLGYDEQTHTISQGSILDMTADAISATIWESGTEGGNLKKTVAELKENGLSVSTRNTDSTSTIDGNGITVWRKVDNTKFIIAEFSRDIAYTNNLSIATFASIGAHRFEAILGHEWDYDENGTEEEKKEKTTMGTGLAWVGKQTEIIEEYDEDTPIPIN